MARYRNPDPRRRPHGMAAVIRWGVWERYVRRRLIEAPGPPAPSVEPDLALLRRDGGPPRLTWIGHASFLATLGGAHFLIDPVFSQRVGWVVRRFGRPGITVSQLPRLTALLLTHNHYDHLDAPSIRRLDRSLPVFVPRGLGRALRRWGFRRVTELEWWASGSAGPLTVTLVPACHWSRRWIGDTNRSLWGGFVVEAGGAGFYHCGDSSWFEGFAEIGGRFPNLLAAMLPIGSYAPAWFMENHHMNPEQAGRAFLRLGAGALVPMHWGTFKLTDESLTAPVDRLRRWWSEHVDERGRRLAIPAVGQTLVFEEQTDAGA